MAVKGVFASDQNIVGNRKGDFASALLQVMPTGMASLYALTSGMESKDAVDTMIHWFEENHITGRFDIASFGTDGDGTVVNVTDASSLVPGTILMNETTGEYVLVTSVSSNAVTVQRGFAGTTATTMTAAHFLQRIGTAFEEGSARPTAVANLGYPRFNYVQIFRNSWDITGTAKAVEYHTGSLIAKNKADCLMFHAEDIERSIMFGKKSLGVLNNKPFRTMDGVMTQITTNVETQTALSWAELKDFLRRVFQKNIKGKPNERIAFCGNIALAVINDLAEANAQLNIEVGQTEFGLKVTRVLTPFGDISLMTHPLLNESVAWQGDMYVLHPGAIRTRYLRRTFSEEHPKNDGNDADFGVTTTEMSVEYNCEITGGKMLGIAGITAP